MYEYTLNTPREGMVDITRQVQEAVRRSGVQSGVALVFVPHTTAAVTINENADPDVVSDLLRALEALVPRLAYRHGEGNSPAHLKSSLLGCSQTVPVAAGRLALGTWQGLYFCEFDGPRQRSFRVTVQGG